MLTVLRAAIAIAPETAARWIRRTLLGRFSLTDVLCAVSIVVLAGCASQQIEGDAPAGSGAEKSFSFFNGFRAGDLTSRTSSNRQSYGTVTGTAGDAPRLYSAEDAASRGDITGSTSATALGTGVRADGNGYQLNFENADVGAVCKSVLGDIMQVNFAVDSRVSGQISLSSAHPVPKASLISLLETALKSVNASIVREGSTYRVVPSGDAVGSGNLEIDTASDGFGTTIIPTRYVGAQTVGRILENFVTRPGAIKVDQNSSLIIVQGSAPERQAVLSAASAIDTQQMRERSVGVFPLANSSPDAVISELNKILDTGEGGTGHSQIQLQAMSRINGVLVVAMHRQGLDQVSRWIYRLDRTDARAVGVKIYRLRFAQAKVVAALLNDTFGSKSTSTGLKDQDALEPSQTGSASQTSSSPASQSQSQASSSQASTSSATSTGSQSQPSPSSVFNQAIFGTPQQTAATSDSSNASASNGGQKIRITADLANNSLLIVASPQDYRLIEQTIHELDRPPVQVAIEATIAEVTLTNQLQYGVQAYLHSSDLGLTKSDQGTIGFTTSTATAAISATVPGANLILGAASSPRFILNALHALTDVKVLSSPSLVVVDNNQATLQVGDQVAVKTQTSEATQSSSAPVINSITYKDTGIILRVTPHVHANGSVNLEVEQEISNVVDNSGGTDGLTPTISQRRVKSNISVNSGQTVLLAGLISESQSGTRNTIPGVEHWQWIGNLLSNNSRLSSRNELIIFIKPKILHDGSEAQVATEEFRSRLDMMQMNTTPSISGPKK